MTQYNEYIGKNSAICDHRSSGYGNHGSLDPHIEPFWGGTISISMPSSVQTNNAKNPP